MPELKIIWHKCSLCWSSTNIVEMIPIRTDEKHGHQAALTAFLILVHRMKYCTKALARFENKLAQMFKCFIPLKNMAARCWGLFSLFVYIYIYIYIWKKSSWWKVLNRSENNLAQTSNEWPSTEIVQSIPICW